jgi:hypothetical protein
MTSLKILQYNTDNLRHGWEYFKRNVEKADIAVLQRFPRAKKGELMELMSGCRSYMVESCPPLDLCLGIARNRHAPNFSGVESITLPSAQHVMALEDPFQGCTALKTIINGVNLVSFLPCYKTEGGEFPISFVETKADIKFLLERFKDEPTIIMGDFHVDPSIDNINHIIKSHGFTSYLDNVRTFRKHGTDEFFNLDKCISNVDIEISGVSVDDVSDSVGHMAITYNLQINKT